MNKLIIYLLLSFSLTSFAQNSKIPFRKANRINIVTSDSIEIAYETINRLIIEHGYAIENSSDKYYSTTTFPKPFKVGEMRLFINVKQNDSTTITLYGTYTVQSMGMRASDEAKFLGTTNRLRMLFDIIDKIAKKYPDGSVFYSKQ